ncbi:capsular polysaccharide biosynthesis protein [Pseudoalteromonas sp. NCCP-2140]|uniref:hypothetical protein n=1 Tax=Pseudoalteromonas sp. NCCP-2140 TaxID=2942288 RepID=UPI00203DB91C|nr:hypothetical protein [Pseudoalteromonas sp. NCCP-2140]GKW54150.1 capsular polysaccharide biosynthesis protein [Pseudoalteromonas sp. NCCP-2140]
MINRLYLYLPYFLQDIIISIYGFFNDRRRYGKHYLNIEKEKRNAMLCAPNDIKEMQDKRLSEALNNAKQSAYWSRVFDDYNVHTESPCPRQELAKLPIMSKSDARKNADDIKIYLPKAISINTSGTTGAGLVFCETLESEAERWAVWWRYRNAVGIDKQQWCALFGGRTIINTNYTGKRFHRINYFSKQVLFSCYHLSPNTVANYINELNSREIKWLHGYPSVISELASLAQRKGLKLNYKVDYITLGAESVNANQLRAIEKFFSVKPTQHYGLAESVANFSQSNPHNSDLIVDEDFSFVEFIPNNNSVDVFRVIGSNFSNPAFPLFRYDTGDLATGVNESVFPRKLKSVDGRKEDFVTLPDGRRIGRLDHIFKDATFVDEAQLIQLEDLSLEVKLVINEEWSEKEHLGELQEAFRLRLGNEIKIQFKKVDVIKRTKSGKFRFVISKVTV